jgi:hypothetical protein
VWPIGIIKRRFPFAAENIEPENIYAKIDEKPFCYISTCLWFRVLGVRFGFRLMAIIGNMQ